jgi:hypothetical protein
VTWKPQQFTQLYPWSVICAKLLFAVAFVFSG